VKVKAYDVSKQADIDATWVLEQSRRFLSMSFGDVAVASDVAVEGEVVELALKIFNAGGVKSAIDLIGRNVNVNAFKDTVDIGINGDMERWVELLAKDAKA